MREVASTRTTHNRYFATPAHRDAALTRTFRAYQADPKLVDGHVQRFRA
jgi:hypothetical protein